MRATFPDYHTVPQVARSLQVGRRSVYRAIKDGKLKAAAINDRGDLRVAPEWLRAYMETLAAGGAK